jgi:hypothetical protein
MTRCAFALAASYSNYPVVSYCPLKQLSVILLRKQNHLREALGR